MIDCLIVYDLSMTRVTGISPSGENERGLIFIGRREHPITIVHSKAYRKQEVPQHLQILLNPNQDPRIIS